MVALLLSAAFAQSHPLADVACAHCHENPHQDVARPCVDCHTTDVWAPSTFTVEQHAATAFPLEGEHADAPCASCHIEAKLVGLPRTCSECHVDRHRGKLGSDCTECHTVQGFTPVPDFDHLVRTGVPLTGHHANLPCVDCHEGDDGRALRLTMTPTCETCHDLGHGRFDVGCSECHPNSDPEWTDAGFDHRRTSFSLERRHRPLDCVACHPVGQERAPDPTCRTCHDDVHAGQLSRTCSDCHRPDRWTVVRFDHDMAAWPLRGRHFVTPCVSCHTNQRWIGLRSECWDCHAVEALQGPANVPAHTLPGADCADCHSQWSWR